MTFGVTSTNEDAVYVVSNPKNAVSTVAYNGTEGIDFTFAPAVTTASRAASGEWTMTLSSDTYTVSEDAGTYTIQSGGETLGTFDGTTFTAKPGKEITDLTIHAENGSDEGDMKVYVTCGDDIWVAASNGGKDAAFFTSSETLSDDAKAAFAGVAASDLTNSVCIMVEKENDSVVIWHERSKLYNNFQKSVTSVRFTNPVAPTELDGGFYYFGYDSESVTFDWTNFDASKMTTAVRLFYNSSAAELDLSSWKTDSLTNMTETFGYMWKLSKLTFGSGWNTSNVTTMNETFDQDDKLKELDLTYFDTSNVTDMYGMFQGLMTVETITLGSGWDTSKVTNMRSMFNWDQKLTLDCSGWNVSQVKYHDNFEYNAPGVTVPVWVS